MYKAKFTLKTITPLFMYGADGKTPEIRASEFKGMMRFWWRAARCENDIKKLFKEEQKIFGGSDEKVGKSTVVIKAEIYSKSLSKVRPLPHSKKKTFKQLAISSCDLFIELASFSNKALEIVKDSFILSVFLGGFGKRSRRGFGSFEINGNNFKNDEGFLKFVVEKLNKNSGENMFRTKGNSIINSKLCGNNQMYEIPKYPWIQLIYLGDSNNNPSELLKQIGQASHDNNDNSLGYGGKNGRLASPVYVSIVKIGSLYKIVATLLYSKFNENCNLKYKQKEFLKQIGVNLGGENE